LATSLVKNMHAKIKADGNTISIMSFSGVEVDDVNSLLKKMNEKVSSNIQLFNAENIAGFKHLFFAAINAINSFNQKRNISDSLAMETMLYASGQRQIKKAIQMIGVKSGNSNIAVLLIEKDEEKIRVAENKVLELLNGKEDKNVLEIKGNAKVERLRGLFGISDKEIEAINVGNRKIENVLTELIIERGAILILEA
jgi:KEOPS complex subunit Cgi121